LKDHRVIGRSQAQVAYVDGIMTGVAQCPGYFG
jgi:hypothetical protein